MITTPVELGPVKLDFPVVQAALSGYSDWPMRVIAKRLGASYSVCEVMLDQFLVAAKKRAKKAAAAAAANPIGLSELVEAALVMFEINEGEESGDRNRGCLSIWHVECILRLLRI